MRHEASVSLSIQVTDTTSKKRFCEISVKTLKIKSLEVETRSFSAGNGTEGL